MTAATEFGVSAPTLALPHKRERGQADVDSRVSFASRGIAANRLPTGRSALPLPLAGEGRGGGLSAHADNTTSAAA
jgi:hypothetical protein